MKLVCPRCSADIASENINIGNVDAHCQSCNFLFSILAEIYRNRLSKYKARKVILDQSKIQFFNEEKQIEEAYNNLRSPTADAPASLRCDDCESEIEERKINRKEMIAYCAKCNQIIDFSAEAFAFNEPKGGVQRQRFKPYNLELADFGNELFFKYRHFNVSQSGYLFPLLVGNLFLLAITYSFRTSSLVIAPIIVELVVIYICLGLLFNSTVVQITKSFIKVKTIPFGWGNQVQVSREDILQMYTREYLEGSGQNSVLKYALCMINAEGRSTYFLSRFSHPEIPLFMEESIEKFWEIKDFPVGDEIKVSRSSINRSA